MSALLLGEKVGWRRWIAIAVGFCGALLVIRPNFATIGPVSLLPLVTATTFAVYLMLNRVLAARDTSLVMQYSAGIGACLVTLVAFALSGVFEIAELRWTPPSTPMAFVLLAAVGLISTFGHLAIVSAFRLAPASLLAPFQYFEIVSGAIFGYLVFSEVPDLGKWTGFAIIIASGLYLLHRERKAAWRDE
jgi:drug/metabolite transporter (DMT)-like permease